MNPDKAKMEDDERGMNSDDESNGSVTAEKPEPGSPQNGSSSAEE
jgi:hypothetical protein